MHGQENENEALERILNDASAEPIMLSYRFLESITENFSKDREIGTGGFGVVYMGMIRNMKVAIKKLSRIDDFSDKQFEDELKCLKKVKHKNIVRLLGYCSDTPKEVVKYNGTYVLAENRIRILCFEYVPNKSLHDYIKDESRERDWVTSYHLIEGVCQGLYYLHNKERINHLDLKPANILLDANMDPKISDFGLSRRFSGERSRIITEHVRGTLGYIAPEYLNKGEISFKTDIYSLGIIIMKLLMGRNDNLFDFEGLHKSVDKDCPQMERCIKIAQLCVDPDQQKRPTIDNVIDMLNVKESMNDDARPSVEQGSNSIQQPGRMDLGQMHFTSEVRSHVSSTAASNLLDIHPRELCFPFKLNEVTRCPVSLTNKTDRYVGVWITPTSPEDDIYKPLECSLIHPHSTWVVSLEMEKQQQPPRRDTQEFEVLMVAMGSKEDIGDLNSSFGNRSNELSMSRDFWKRVEELGAEVHITMLTTIICDPAIHEVAGKNKIIPRGQLGGIIVSMDVHPTETWILTGHEGGFVSIWSYETQEREMALQVAKQPTYRVYSVKFIAQEKWFAAGVGYGHVWVYDYTSTTKNNVIKKFRAHGSKPVTSLAVHPTYPYLLTSSQDDNSIKLWDWAQGWSCARTFDGHTSGVGSLTFSRWDFNSFASVGYDGGEAKTWNIHSSKPMSTVVGPDRIDYLHTDSARDLLVASCTPCAYIWDLQRQEFTHKLGGHGFTVCDVDVASHPTLPILATSSTNGTVYFWDTGTYRLEKILHLPPLGVFVDLALIGTQGLTRVLVGYTDGIAIMEIDLLQKASCSVSKLAGEVQSTVVCAPPLDSTSSSEVDFHETTSSKAIDIYSQEFCFPFKPNNHLQYPVTLTNRTDHYVGVWITPKGPNLWVNKSLENPCSFFLMKPNSTWAATVTTKKQQQLPPRETCKFEMTMIVMGAKHAHPNFESHNGSDLLKLVEESGGKLPQAMLAATIYNPTNRKIVKIHQIIPAMKFGCVFSMDVHLTEPWILTGHDEGFVSIWNYQTQQMVKSFEVTTSSVSSVKFIVRDQLIAVVAGDANGWVHVINDCFNMNKVKTFEAHPEKSVDSLAVHSTYQILLSSSSEDSKIMLWEWDQDWVCTKIFQGHNSGVRSLTFDPRDINIFASVGMDNNAKVWNISNSSSDIIPSSVELQKLDYFFTDRNGDFVISCDIDQIENADIWDLQTKDHLQTLAVFMRSNLHKNEVGVDSGEISGQVYDDAKNNGKKDSGGGDNAGSSSHQLLQHILWQGPPPGIEMDDYYDPPQNYSNPLHSMFSDENANACSMM